MSISPALYPVDLKLNIEVAAYVPLYYESHYENAAAVSPQEMPPTPHPHMPPPNFHGIGSSTLPLADGLSFSGNWKLATGNLILQQSLQQHTPPPPLQQNTGEKGVKQHRIEISAAKKHPLIQKEDFS